MTELPKYSLVENDSLNAAATTILQVPGSTLETRSGLQILADRAGICLSVICIVHCILTPIILVLLPMLQIFEIYHGSMHVVFACIIPALALAAFIPGYKL